MSSSKYSNENTQNFSLILPTWGPTHSQPCWPPDVGLLLGCRCGLCAQDLSLTTRHLTTTPWGAIGCDPVSQSRAWDLKRKEDYPRPCLSNKQELLTARPHFPPVGEQIKEATSCPFTIYLQIPTMGTACSKSCTQLPQHLCSLTNRGTPWIASESALGAGWKLQTLFESPILRFTRAAELALWYQLQRYQVQGHPESQAASRRVALFV